MGSDKRGAPRVWLEGRRLAQSGFCPSARYEIGVDHVRRSITLRLAANGDRIVSRKTKGEIATPVIDIANARLLSAFEGLQTLKVRFEEGAVVISASASDMRRIERAARLRAKVDAGLPLRVGSVSTGLGALALAMHQGLSAAGLESSLAFSVEIDEGYQERCAAANPCWNASTLAISSPMQELAFDKEMLAELPQVEILEAGIPCTAHSSAGRAKKGLAMPEDDPRAGHLVAGFLAIVAASNPSIVLVENVPQYMTSASFAILSNQLAEWGYDVRSTVLRGSEFGCLEHRDRMALVASTPGIDVDLDTLAPLSPPVPRLGDVLDEVPDDSTAWSTMAYLRAKQERDRAAGNDFRMQIFGEESAHVSTIGRGYAKIRSTEPKIRNRTNPEMLRPLTPAEPARIKGIPETLVDGIPQTTAHELLGQSIVFAPFRALGERIGGAIVAWSKGVAAPRGQVRPKAVLTVNELPLFAC